MLRRKRRREPDPCVEAEHETRLVDAEKRANVLVEKAQSLRTAVSRRDQDNHWQDSVNSLFLGGSA